MSQVLAQDMPSQGSFLAISTVMLDVFILEQLSKGGWMMARLAHKSFNPLSQCIRSPNWVPPTFSLQQFTHCPASRRSISHLGPLRPHLSTLTPSLEPFYRLYQMMKMIKQLLNINVARILWWELMFNLTSIRSNSHHWNIYYIRSVVPLSEVPFVQ